MPNRPESLQAKESEFAKSKKNQRSVSNVKDSPGRSPRLPTKSDRSDSARSRLSNSLKAISVPNVEGDRRSKTSLRVRTDLRPKVKFVDVSGY
jgi:hypothetical protein